MFNNKGISKMWYITQCNVVLAVTEKHIYTV